MPSFDLKGIKVATYTNTSGTVTYSNATSAGGAMSAQIEVRFAEGRLYAESKLAEYMKLATGGTISLAVKDIPATAQNLMFGCTVDSSTSAITYSALDVSKYVGCAFYAADQVNGTTKYTCVFIPKCMFGVPAMNYNTKGENITFNTPTTTGEFLPDDSSAEKLLVVETVNTESAAQTWVNTKLNVSAQTEE